MYKVGEDGKVGSDQGSSSALSSLWSRLFQPVADRRADALGRRQRAENHRATRGIQRPQPRIKPSRHLFRSRPPSPCVNSVTAALQAQPNFSGSMTPTFPFIICCRTASASRPSRSAGALHQHQPRLGRIMPQPHARRRQRLPRRLFQTPSPGTSPPPPQPRESAPPSPLPAGRSPSGSGKDPAPSTPPHAPSAPRPPPHRSARPDLPAHARPSSG